MINKAHEFQSILGLLIYFILIPTIVLVSDISKIALYNRINTIYPTYDIVFSSTLVNSRYGYFDSIYDLRLRHQGKVMSADIYMQPELNNNKDWLSVNWLLNEDILLNENEVALSRNLAIQHNISIGASLQLGESEVMVVEFLPPYKGFYSKFDRDGVLLTHNDSGVFQSARKQMYFNTEPYANFINSEIIRTETYIGNNSYELFISLIFLIITIAALPGFIYQNHDLNKRKIKVFSLENRKMWLIHLESAKSLLFPLILTSFLSFFVVFLINFPMISSLIYPYYLGFFLSSVLIILLLHLFIFFKFSKLRSRND